VIKSFWDISLIFGITFFLILLGFYLARKIIYPIVEITAHAKDIAEGRLDESLNIGGEDELGELSSSLNNLSGRLKENMTELHSYGEKIKQINMEINKKVFALSTLLQIGTLITATTDLDEIFSLTTEKLAQLETGGAAFLMLPGKEKGTLTMRAQVNIDEDKAASYKVKVGQGAAGVVVRSGRPFIVDADNKPKVVDEELKEILATENLAILPVTCAGKIVGVLGTGNNLDNFSFSDDEIELIGVFAKQVAVALENDTLIRRTQQLTVRDELTGLYNESYIRSRLDEEIKRAISYQRPCSLVILEIEHFSQYHSVLGDIGVEKVLKKIAHIIKEGTTDVDKIARFSDHQFALVMPEKNKKQALNIMKNLKEEIERFGVKQGKLEPAASLTIAASATSTPIDGTTSVELVNQALRGIKRPNR